MIICIDNSKNKIQNDWGNVSNGIAEMKGVLAILSLPLTHYIEKYRRHSPSSPYTLRNIFLVVFTVRKRFVDSSVVNITCRSCKTFLFRDMSHSFKSQVPGKATALKGLSWNPWIQLQTFHPLPLCKTGAVEQQVLWRCMLLSTRDTTVKKKILVYIALCCKFK